MYVHLRRQGQVIIKKKYKKRTFKDYYVKEDFQFRVTEACDVPVSTIIMICHHSSVVDALISFSLLKD